MYVTIIPYSKSVDLCFITQLDKVNFILLEVLIVYNLSFISIVNSFDRFDKFVMFLKAKIEFST